MTRSNLCLALMTSLGFTVVNAKGVSPQQPTRFVHSAASYTVPNTRFEHHHGVNPSTDVDFGSPADVQAASRTILFSLAPDGKVNETNAVVIAHQTIRFDLQNTTNQPVAFVIGDEHAIREYASAYSSQGASLNTDFHALSLTPGQASTLGWRFDTYGANTIYAAYVGVDGNYRDKPMVIRVKAVAGK